MRPARLVLAALAALALTGGLAACGDDDDAGGGAAAEIEGVEEIRVPPYEHTQADVDYDESPPVGGDHGPDAVPCEFFDDAVPDEPAVHTLEHGGVWLAYDPALPDGDLEVLRGLVDEYEDVFASPYADLRAGEAVVASAWGAQLRLDSVDDERLEQFVDGYRRRDTAPEANIGCG